MKPIASSLILAFFLAASPTAFAVDKEPPLQTKALDKANFEQQVVQIRKEMELGGRYQFVKDSERSQVNQALDEMNRLFSDRISIRDMTEEERVAMFNAQERANGILTKRDGERLICEHKRSIGSNQKQTVCQTYADQQIRRQNSQQQASKIKNNNPLPTAQLDENKNGVSWR